MLRLREEVAIGAPPAAVWHAVHEDVAGTVRWAGYVRRAEAIGGPLGVGARVLYELNLPGGTRTDLVLQYTVWEPHRRAAGRFAEGPLRGTWSYTYTERQGATDLVYEMDYEMRGLLRFAGGLLQGQYEAGIRQGMVMLKQHVEASSKKHS